MKADDSSIPGGGADGGPDAAGATATPSGTVCPDCGAPGRPVKLKTVKHLLDYRFSHTVSGEGWLYCADPDCGVYYFRMAAGSPGPAGAAGMIAAGPPPADAPSLGWEVYRAAQIKERARPLARGAERIVCFCFGHTVGDIVSDARSGRNRIPAAITAEVKAGMCACEVLNPGGG